MRDEDEQATYVREVPGRVDAEGIDSALYTFARYDLPHRAGPAADLDMASAGVVKVLDETGAGESRGRRYPDMPWEPKAAFDALADWFGRDSRNSASSAALTSMTSEAQGARRQGAD